MYALPGDTVCVGLHFYSLWHDNLAASDPSILLDTPYIYHRDEGGGRGTRGTQIRKLHELHALTVTVLTVSEAQ